MQNIVGGPSIIFKRYHEKNKSFIRNNVEIPCKKVLGFDANALYLWALDQKMPVGNFIRRKRINGFKPEKNEKYVSMFYWMDWLNFTQKTEIQHFQNQGKEKRIGPYLVDGYDCRTNTVYQFHGCYFHGHLCSLTKHIKKENLQKLLTQRRERTMKISSFIKQRGYNIIEIYECQFNEMKRNSKNLRDFIWTHQSSFTRKFAGRVSEKQIIEGIKSDELFGLVEVDISVPTSWDEVSNPPNTSLSPYEYYKEMTPLFGNVDIPFEKIGQHMQDHINKYNLSKKPRRLLVGVMKAEQYTSCYPPFKMVLKSWNESNSNLSNHRIH